MDKQWWSVMGDEVRKNFKGDLVTQSHKGFERVTPEKHKPSGGNSGAGAIALAAHYGAVKVCVLGCDCKYQFDEEKKKEKRHWHGDHPRGLGNAVSVPKFYAQFQDIARKLFKIQIINCSPDSALDFWPVMPIAEALRGSTVDLDAFWNRKGLNYIIPEKSKTEFPEGFDVLSTLRDWIGDTVTEVGCGYGRLAGAFDNYTGYDINAAALERGKELHPGHAFKKMPKTIKGDTVLLYTVLLHIPDNNLEGFIKRIRCKRLLICEIMDRKFRRPLHHDEVPGFNRNPEEYEKLGKVIRRERFPYLYYPGEYMTWLLIDREGM